jgi:drug/metabolite transporter (DMT)-like permease
MTTADLLRLITLSAIWGASYLFMRIGAPVLGPVLLIALRLALAALFLWVVALALKKRLNLRAHWRHYAVLGLFNSALPFLFFAIAARTLPASLLSVLNATAPIWAAVITAIWTRKMLSRQAVLGLATGIAGVSLLVGFDPATLGPGAPLAIALSLAASLCYGIASLYANLSKRQVEPFANAHGSMWAAALWIAPAAPFFPTIATPSLVVLAIVLALGIVCSGVAYLLYFRLIQDVGAASALTVTFLVPVFGVLWGYLILNEPVGWHTLAGACAVICGTAWVTGFSPTALLRRAG